MITVWTDGCHHTGFGCHRAKRKEYQHSNLKYIREAAAGYQFNKWYGLNVEMGIFMSYIGLESYITAENCSYQRSMVCDFTPF